MARFFDILMTSLIAIILTLVTCLLFFHWMGGTLTIIGAVLFAGIIIVASALFLGRKGDE